MIDCAVVHPATIHAEKKHHLGVDIQHLVDLTKQKSYTMPSGLTREERRAWAKRVQQNTN